MLLNLAFVNNTIFPCFLSVLLIFDLYFLIPAVIAQIFNPATETVIPIEMPTNKAKAEIETSNRRS